MNLSPQEQSVCDSIAARAEAMYRDLERHVAIPTGHDFEPGLRAYRDELRARLEGCGATTEMRQGRERPWWMEVSPTRTSSHEGQTRPPHSILIARHEANPSRRILIAGHIDTVHDPNGPFQSLTRAEDGCTAVGPGAVDMKGGIVCALHALESVHGANIPCNWTFTLNSDEERGSFESEHVLRDEAAKHDFGIALEPALADGSLATERMGSGQFMVDIRGVAAHVGREFEKGRSAVTRLGEILIALANMGDPERGMIVNAGPVTGGTATNIVPDSARCWGNVRYATPDAGEELGRMIDGLKQHRDGVHVTVHRHWNRPAKPLTPEVEAFSLRAREAAEDLGQSLPFAATGGVCDGNIMQDAGLPTLDTLGIRGGNLHREDEFIEIAALVERSQLLAVLLMRLAHMSNDS